MSELSIYQRIHKIRQEATRVGKDVQIGTGRNAYKAVSYDAVLKVVMPLMLKYDVSHYVLELKEETIRETYQALDYNTKQMVDKLRTFTKAHMVTRFVNIDDKEDYFDVQSIGHGDDPADKAAGKAQTYASKYALINTFGLETGENDEARHDYSEGAAPVKPTYQAPQPQPKPITSKAAIIKAFQQSTTKEILQAKFNKAEDIAEYKGDSELLCAFNAQMTRLENV